MKVASLADVKARLSSYIDECATKGPVVITRNGKAAAVLVAPQNDEDLECLLLARSPQFQSILNRSRQSISEGRALPRNEFWRTVSRTGKSRSKNPKRRK